MRIPRVFLPQAVRPGARVPLPPQEARHLVRVLRRGEGEAVEILSPAGKVLKAVICEVVSQRGEGPQVVVEVGCEVPREPPPVVPWVVGAAVAKGGSFDQAVRLASELGLERIIPLETERTLVRSAQGGNKQERWARIAQEAAKQCGRALPLRVEPVSPLKALLESPSLPEGRWMPLCGAQFPPADAFLGPGSSGGPLELVPSLFLVGPEGGFSPGEVEEAMAAGFQPLGFPTPVLRTSSAVALVAALGVLLSIFPIDFAPR